jgi:hypothetical protein
MQEYGGKKRDHTPGAKWVEIRGDHSKELKKIIETFWGKRCFE